MIRIGNKNNKHVQCRRSRQRAGYERNKDEPTDDITELVDRVYVEYKDASVLKLCHMIAVNIQSKFVKPIEAELEKCYVEIAGKDAMLAEKFDYVARIRDRLAHEHYELGKNVESNAEEMRKVRDIIDYIEGLK